ncbi:MAG TPA: hypothetical protein VN697_03465 [Tepidiformaceae bacterium]|nr:hypothetical protein [Tepidiformaceae bacterium]
MARRKRPDPTDTNILSDPQYDQVLNADPSKKYWYVSDEDMPTAFGRGYARTERSANGPRPAKWYDGIADHGPGYRVNNQLTLMEIDKERGEAIQHAAEERHNRVLKATQAKIKDPSQDDTRYLSYSKDPGYRNRFNVTASEEAR